MLDRTGRDSQLFRVRLWTEELGTGQTEYRGSVSHVVSGDTRHFRDWAGLETFLMSKIKVRDPGDITAETSPSQLTNETNE